MRLFAAGVVAQDVAAAVAGDDRVGQRGRAAVVVQAAAVWWRSCR